MNHYPRHIGDWMTATAHLTAVEECMYSRFLDQYYAREGPLPLDLGACGRLVRAASPTEHKAVAVVLAEFFTEEPDGRHQKRCDEEIRRYRERSASASESAQARWNKRNANAHANASETHNVGNANQNQNQNQKKNKHQARKRAGPIPDGFSISDRVRQWALAKGVGFLDERFEHFVGYAKRSGKCYVDWDEAFMSAVREDWAKLNATPKAAAAWVPSDKVAL